MFGGGTGLGGRNDGRNLCRGNHRPWKQQQGRCLVPEHQREGILVPGQTASPPEFIAGVMIDHPAGVEKLKDIKV